MKRWLFLRSAHKGGALTSPPPIQILDPHADMWTGLFSEIVRQVGGEGQVRVLGEPCEVLGAGLTIRRDRDFTSRMEKPDVVFNRGGYADYLPALHAWPDAVRVYYGAGKRYCPADGIFYHVILVDTHAQREKVAAKHPDSRVAVFHKPAAACFVPLDAEKRFDVVFVCHTAAEFKGHRWLISRLPKHCRVLRIGSRDPWFAAGHDSGQFDVMVTGNIRPGEIPAWACQARVGVVCDDGTADSGPRILPEYLAMNIPVVVRDTVRVDVDAYVTSETGLVGDDNTFADRLEEVLGDWPARSPRRFYEQHLAMERAAARIVSLVQDGRGI